MDTVRPLWENQVHGWLTRQIKEKGLRVGYQARAALVQRFGTDRAALGRALEQLQGENRPISAEMIVERFRNRPDQPVFRILDEILAGDERSALRRLGDYLANARPSDGRPHILLGALESDLRLRLLASQARDREHFQQMEEENAFSRMLESAAGPLDEQSESRMRSAARGQGTVRPAPARPDLESEKALQFGQRLRAVPGGPAGPLAAGPGRPDRETVPGPAPPGRAGENRGGTVRDIPGLRNGAASGVIGKRRRRPG